MTRVDFYLLESTRPQALEQFTCRLVEKAHGLGHRVFVHLASADHARQLDELLWTFREQSFIPHGLAASTDPVEPVQIGHGQEPPHGFETLVNLHSEVPLFFSRFERVAEIVPADEAARQTARERYRFYKDRGYPLKTHRL